jgi:hypothetical protein
VDELEPFNQAAPKRDFEKDDYVKIINDASTLYGRHGHVTEVTARLVMVMLEDEHSKIIQFGKSEIELIKGRQEKTADELVEYRCSKCGQIGGDSEKGPYDGCDNDPQGGKHDMNGGTV